MTALALSGFIDWSRRRINLFTRDRPLKTLNIAKSFSLVFKNGDGPSPMSSSIAATLIRAVALGGVDRRRTRMGNKDG